MSICGENLMNKNTWKLTNESLLCCCLLSCAYLMLNQLGREIHELIYISLFLCTDFVLLLHNLFCFFLSFLFLLVFENFVCKNTLLVILTPIKRKSFFKFFKWGGKKGLALSRRFPCWCILDGNQKMAPVTLTAFQFRTNPRLI